MNSNRIEELVSVYRDGLFQDVLPFCWQILAEMDRRQGQVIIDADEGARRPSQVSTSQKT